MIPPLMVLWCLSWGNRPKEKLKFSKYLKFPRDLPFQNVIPIDQGSMEDIIYSLGVISRP